MSENGSNGPNLKRHSAALTEGRNRAAARAMLKAIGFTDDDLHKPIIGVAKTAYHAATHAIAIHRGRAVRPLYVTAAGLPADRAAALVTAMAGAHRIPDALRQVDTLARRGRDQR